MRLAVWASVWVSLLASPALAQLPVKPPTTQQKQQAGDLVKQAIEKSQAGDHQAAIELYLEAYTIVPLPLLWSNVGSEYKALQLPVESLRYFCKYLEAEPTGTNASYATSEAKVIQIQLGNQTVDDKTACAPLPEAHAPPPPHRDATLEIRPEAGATTSTADAPGHGLQVGGMVVAGVGIVGLAVGIYFGTQARAISNEISDHDPSQPWPSDINDRERTGQSDENKQIVFLVAGGITAGAGVVLYMMGRSRTVHAHAPGVGLVPVATPDRVGLALDGRF